MRSLKSPFSREYAKLEYHCQNDEDLQGKAGGAFRRAAVEGDEKNGCFLAGQVAGMIHKTQPAAEIIREIFEEGEAVLSEVSRKWVK